MPNHASSLLRDAVRVGTCCALALALTAGTNAKGDWKKAKKQNTVASLAKYLEGYPAGEFSDSARVHMESLMWLDALAKDTPRAYLQLTTTFPSTVWADSAQRLAERARWREARLADTPAAYQAYLSETTRGDSVAVAQREIAFLRAVGSVHHEAERRALIEKQRPGLSEAEILAFLENLAPDSTAFAVPPSDWPALARAADLLHAAASPLILDAYPVKQTLRGAELNERTAIVSFPNRITKLTVREGNYPTPGRYEQQIEVFTEEPRDRVMLGLMGPIVFHPGATMRFAGKTTLGQYVFTDEGGRGNRLTFRVCDDGNFRYLRGKGTVRLPSGQEVRLPN